MHQETIGEMKHAEVLMECILFLDGAPTMKPLDLTIGKNVQEMLQRDLDFGVLCRQEVQPTCANGIESSHTRPLLGESFGLDGKNERSSEFTRISVQPS